MPCPVERIAAVRTSNYDRARLRNRLPLAARRSVDEDGSGMVNSHQVQGAAATGRIEPTQKGVAGTRCNPKLSRVSSPSKDRTYFACGIPFQTLWLQVRAL